MSTNPPPKHRYEMKLTLGANTLDALTHELRHIADDLEREQRDEARELTSGSPGASFHMIIDHDPTMTEERYLVELAAWSKARREARRERSRERGL